MGNKVFMDQRQAKAVRKAKNNQDSTPGPSMRPTLLYLHSLSRCDKSCTQNMLCLVRGQQTAGRRRPVNAHTAKRHQKTRETPRDRSRLSFSLARPAFNSSACSSCTARTPHTKEDNVCDP
ncbi:hypothetical protein PoB_006616200 [Plakobranchus ocellatus]|uniref:Small EDRK-rich factor-like N-terminal domain-containing protein n=1 Tax=Plakobranchus ocellatus TaxID=259542 RepID=A0AAV4D688_9GAST|nr:hypothetical protein PoB_006616200 [Plakobranchus ocellatus]